MKIYNNLGYTSLFVECDLSSRNGPSRTSGTAKGVSEEKIVLRGQEASRVLGFAQKQNGWEV